MLQDSTNTLKLDTDKLEIFPAWKLGENSPKQMNLGWLDFALRTGDV